MEGLKMSGFAQTKLWRRMIVFIRPKPTWDPRRKRLLWTLALISEALERAVRLWGEVHSGSFDQVSARQ